MPQRGAPAWPKGPLRQMGELIAALNADLCRLDADLSGNRPVPVDGPDRARHTRGGAAPPPHGGGA